MEKKFGRRLRLKKQVSEKRNSHDLEIGVRSQEVPWVRIRIGC